MAFPTVSINNSTGSSFGNASGSNAPTTPLTGTNATWGGSTITLDGSPDLSGLNDDDSDVIYIATTTGRRFFRITAVNDGADQVTVEDAPGGTSGQAWAIGGKLDDCFDANICTYLIEADLKGGWALDIEQTGTNYTKTWATNAYLWDQLLGGASGDFTDGPIKIFSSSATKPILDINFTANGPSLWRPVSSISNSVLFENLQFEVSASTGLNNLLSCQSVWGTYLFKDLVIGIYNSATNTLHVIKTGGNTSPNMCRVHNVHFKPHKDDGVPAGTAIGVSGTSTGGKANLEIYGCYFDEIPDPIRCGNDTTLIAFTIIKEADDVGILWTGSTAAQTAGNLAVLNCVIWNGGSHGIRVVNAECQPCLTVLNNIINANSGWGVLIDDTEWNSEQTTAIVDYNCWGTGTGNGGANSSGTVSGIGDEGVGSNNQSVNPGFTDPTNGDFSIDTTLKADGWPGVFPGAETTGYLDIGAAQREEPAGGGGGLPQFGTRMKVVQ